MNKEMSLQDLRIQELENELAILKQKQIEITEAKELYLKIFEEFPALIWRSRLDKLCDYFNKTWLEFTGRTMEQEFGNGWTEGVHPDDFDFCVQTYVTAFDKREAFLMDYRMKNKSGEYRWIRDFGRPFFDLDNSFLGYIGSCYDITDKKTSESQLIELNATKDKFFSIIAHDLKGPFNSILGFSEVLMEEVKKKDYGRTLEYAEIILKSSSRVMDLLTNLMYWAQSQSGRMDIHPEIFRMDTLIKDVTLLLKDMAGQKSISIKNSLTSKQIVYADKAMISAVLRNLISNAVKFTKPEGKILISAVVSLNELIVTVKDNGIGIPNESIDKLFNIAESLSTPGTLDEKGTGLGLILCHDFIIANNGRIWVESQVGLGSAFFFSVPLGTD